MLYYNLVCYILLDHSIVCCFLLYPSIIVYDVVSSRLDDLRREVLRRAHDRVRLLVCLYVMCEYYVID